MVLSLSLFCPILSLQHSVSEEVDAQPAAFVVHLHLVNLVLELSLLLREAVFQELVFLPGQILDLLSASS